MGCKKSVQGRFIYDSRRRNIKIQVKFDGSTGCQMGQGWHRTRRRMYNFLWNENCELRTGAKVIMN
jgi:hypothetical protein